MSRVSSVSSRPGTPEEGRRCASSRSADSLCRCRMDLYPTRSFPSWWENYPISGLLKKLKPSATAVRYVMVLSREKENSDSDHDQTSGTRDERSEIGRASCRERAE